MSSLSDFANRMRKLARDLPGQANKRTVKLASLIHQTLVLATPVDTGHARLNWQVGINEVPTDELPGGDPSGQETIARGRAALESRQPDQTINITNNAPYIRRLNEGWSAQAPAGFVEKAIGTAMAAAGKTRLLK